jgi:hypothetical protein
MNLKKLCTCQLCHMILDDPVSLPCKCLICHRHLIEKSFLLKNKRIKCLTCNQTHQITRDGFRACKAATKLIEQTNDFIKKEMFLSDVEKQLKLSLRNEFLQFKNKFEHKMNEFESKSRQHFSLLKEKVEMRKEQLKHLIDETFAEITKALANREETILKEINETYSNALMKSQMEENFEKILNEFRFPTLNFLSLNQLILKQNTLYSNIKLNSDESKVFLKKIKQINFKPNSNFKIDTASFGDLDLNDSTNVDVVVASVEATNNLTNKTLNNMEIEMATSLESKILSRKQSNELIELCEFSSNEIWTLLYRGSRDGFSTQSFHDKCDGHTPTLTIIKGKTFFVYLIFFCLTGIDFKDKFIIC